MHGTVFMCANNTEKLEVFLISKVAPKVDQILRRSYRYYLLFDIHGTIKYKLIVLQGKW